MALFLLPGLLGTVLLMRFAAPIAAALSMSEAALSVMAVAPSLLLSVFTGTARGWFQGHHNMLPTAVSEVLEAGGKLGFGLLFSSVATARGCAAPTVAAAAILGITAGVALSSLFLWVALLCFPCRHARGSLTRPSRRQILRELWRVALPITAASAVMSLVSLADTALISGRLQAAILTKRREWQTLWTRPIVCTERDVMK